MARKARPSSEYDKHLTARLDHIETILQELVANRKTGGGHDHGHDHGTVSACALPSVPERVFAPNVSSEREELIRYVDKFWVNGTNLRYYLFDSGPWGGTKSDLEFMREAFDIWADVGIGLTFTETNDLSEAEVRVGFKRGEGSWSYVGRDILQYPGQAERTMNIGWDLNHDPRGVDTAVHEIGHTLGFPHEHQNPFSGIVWDEDEVYRYFGGAPNHWSRDQTFHNVLRKLSTKDVEGSDWDPDSIMHYGFGAGLILSPPEYQTGLRPKLGLSTKDKDTVRRFYPAKEAMDTNPLLPFQSRLLEMEPSTQLSFVIRPTATRVYTMGTFGQADILSVLFQKTPDGPRYVAGSDDSGTDDNSRIETRLYAGEEYILRLRLFTQYGADGACVMVW